MSIGSGPASVDMDDPKAFVKTFSAAFERDRLTPSQEIRMRCIEALVKLYARQEVDDRSTDGVDLVREARYLADWVETGQ